MPFKIYPSKTFSPWHPFNSSSGCPPLFLLHRLVFTLWVWVLYRPSLSSSPALLMNLPCYPSYHRATSCNQVFKNIPISGLDGLPTALECDGIWGRREHPHSPKTSLDPGPTHVQQASAELLHNEYGGI